MQKYDGYLYSLCYKDSKEKCDKYNFLYFITNSILLHHAETMYSIYIVIYLCIIVNNYDSSKESVIGEFVDVVSRCMNNFLIR